MTISIVMAALNEEKYITMPLISLNKQKEKDMEIIVVDNESTDRTAEIAAKYGAKVIKAPRGKLNARDAGIRAAKGEIIVSVDADSYYPLGWLDRLVSHFKPGIAGVGGKRVYDRGFHWVTWLPISRFFGGNSAFRKEAYIQSGGFRLDTDQFSLVSMVREEEIRFKKRLQKYGKVVIDKKAKVITSSRRFNDEEFKRQVRNGERF